MGQLSNQIKFNNKYIINNAVNIFILFGNVIAKLLSMECG